MLIKVVKRGTQWAVEYDGKVSHRRIKARAIGLAFQYAKLFSPATVKIYSAKGKMQVASNW